MQQFFQNRAQRPCGESIHHTTPNVWTPLSKTRLRAEQNKQEEELMARLLTCKLENSRLQERWVSCRSQTAGFWPGKCAKVIWLFQKSGSPVVFSLFCIREAESGPRKHRHGVDRLGAWELVGVVYWFLSRAVNPCSVRRSFLYVPVLTISVSPLTWVTPF